MEIPEALTHVRTTAEIQLDGMSKPALARRVARGSITCLRRGVYISTAHLDGLSPTEKALIDHIAVLKTTQCGVLSYLSAALWWGCWLNSVPQEVELSYAGQTGAQRFGVKVHKRRELAVRFSHRLHGYRVTNPLQTTVDCARTLPLLDGLVIADSMLSRGFCEQGELRAELLAVKGPGSRMCRLVAERMSALAGSPAETRARNLFYEWGLALPRQQFEVRTRSGGRRFADFAWPEQKVILEVDGFIKYSGQYGEPAEVIVKEHWRDKQLEQLGWKVLHTTVEELSRYPGALYDRLLSYGVPASASYRQGL